MINTDVRLMLRSRMKEVRELGVALKGKCLRSKVRGIIKTGIDGRGQ